MVSWSEVTRWDAAEVAHLAHRVNGVAHAMGGIGDDLVAAIERMEWTGDAADAARASLHALHRRHLARAGELGDIGHRVDALANSMYPLLSVVRDCEAAAADNSMSIDPAGVVAAQFPVYAVAADDAWDAERERRTLERSLSAQVAEVLRRATELDASAADAFRRIGEGDSDDAGRVETTVPVGSSPAAVSAFWKSLTQAERTTLLVGDPGTIGNLDGIPASVRDTANRRMLTLERTRLERVAADLTSQLDRNRVGGLLTDADAGLVQTVRRLEALDAITRTLEQGDRQLLVLDNTTGEDTLAAIGTGNVHTATHVAVFVPGLGTDVRGDAERYDADVAALGRTAEDMVPEGESVACVTWMNYQAPHLGWSLLDPRRTVVTATSASIGAPRLRAFLDGLDASRGPDPHLSLLGHSYGSLTAAIALRDSNEAGGDEAGGNDAGGDEAGVDAFVALGSPGLGVGGVANLSVPPGHVFAAEARGDVVADLGAFGGDPSRSGGVENLFTGTDVEHGTTQNVGHSSYLTPGTTAQRQVALVVAGRRDDVTG